MKNKRQSTIKVLIRIPMQPYSEVIPNTISKIIHDIEKEHGATHALEYEKKLYHQIQVILAVQGVNLVILSISLLLILIRR